MKKIFSKKWIFFTIGCLCTAFLLFIMQSWLTLLALVFLIYTHPQAIEEAKKMEKAKDAPLISVIILIILSIVSILLSSAAMQREQEQAHAEILAAQREEERIATALEWDIDADPSLSEEEKDLVRKAADNAIKNEKQCVHLITGGQSTIAKNSYYVQCLNSNDWNFNLYFTKEDIASGKPIRIEEPYKDASTVCYNAILGSAKYSDTVSYKQLIDLQTFINGDTDIIQDFTAENALGMDVRYRATCTISKDGHLTEFSIE